MYNKIWQKGGVFHVLSQNYHILMHIHSPYLYVYSNLCDAMKKADRLSTYRLFVCSSSNFDILYYSTDSLMMQCVFSPIKRLFSIYYTLLYSTILLTTQRILQSSAISAISPIQLFHI